MFKYEEIKAHKQRYTRLHSRGNTESSLDKNRVLRSEKDHSCLMTIPEETETNDAAELHDKIQTNVGIHVKQGADIIDTVGYQNTRLTADYVGETEEVTVRVTEGRRRNMSQVGTTYVNGQEVLAAFDSCSSLTLIHHELIVTSSNSNISSIRVTNSVDIDTIGIKNQGNLGQNYETLLENLLQPDYSLIDTEIDTETPCTAKPAESEQTRQKKYGQGHRVPTRHKAFTAHLHFPFENKSIPQFNNYMKDKDP